MSGHRIHQDKILAKDAGVHIIPDPGDGKTIPVNIDGGICPLVLGAGSETRKLADSPTSAAAIADGVEITLWLKTDGGGSLVIDFGSFTTIDGTNYIATFADVDDWIRLVAIGGKWNLVANHGVALS